jgi:beta-catenin-like protein 1
MNSSRQITGLFFVDTLRSVTSCLVVEIGRNIIHIFYNFTRFLDDTSPHDAKQRFLVKLLDHDKLDRLVELLLYYDDKARKAEFKFYLQADDDADTNDNLMAMEALSAKLAGGGDLFHRLGAICAFVCVHSKRAHKHILDQLTLQQSGIGLVKTALVEFISLLASDDVDKQPSKQKKQLQEYLEQL